jgi:hypothetical protein
LLGFFFIYLLPAAMHFKCLYIDAVDLKNNFSGVLKQIKKFCYNHNAKVFEVVIDVTSIDTSLRPAMTTSNSISTNTLKNVLSIPIECVHTEGTKSFVYKLDDKKAVKQEVKIGASNETHTVILKGLFAKEAVYLSIPKDTLGIKWAN